MISRTGRIGILVLGLGLAAGLAFTLGRFRSVSGTELDLQHVMDEARSALEAEEYQRAADLLTPHFATFYDDPETLEVFADAVSRVPHPGNLHIAAATRAYRRVVELDAKRGHALRQLFDLYQRTGKHDLALETGRQLLQLRPKDAQVLLEVARLLLAGGNTRQCRARVQQALETEPESLSAYQLLFESMLRAGETEQDVLAFIDETTALGSVSKTDLQLIYAHAVGDHTGAEWLLEESCRQSTGGLHRTTWLVEKLESLGQLWEAVELLRRDAERLSSRELRRLLAYRLFQRDALDELVTLLDAMRAREPLSSELQILHVLALHRADDGARATGHLETLVESRERLPRVWVPVLRELVHENGQTHKLLAACAEGLKIYPQNAYLLFIQGSGYRVAGEDELALEAFRKASRYAPNWFAARLATARSLASQGNHRLAFAEVSIALRQNPTSLEARDVALQVALGARTAGRSLTRKQQQGVEELLQRALEREQATTTRQFLLAARARLRGNVRAAEGYVQSMLTEADLDVPTLKTLKLLTPGGPLQEQLDERLTLAGGVSFGGLIEHAEEVAEQDGFAAATRFLEAYRPAGKSWNRLTREMAVAELAYRHGVAEHANRWQRLFDQHADDPHVLQHVLHYAFRTGERTLQRRAIDALKGCALPGSITWQVAEARYLLAGDHEEKTAALVALNLTELLKRVPTQTTAYGLLVTAYDRLGQPQKSIEVLRTALEEGVASPLLQLELAERLAETTERPLARDHALRAARDGSCTKAMRLRAANVLIKTESFGEAAQLLGKDVPTEPADTSDDFAMVSAFAMALAKSGSPDQAKPLIAKLAADRERWYRLWLSVTAQPETPPAVATAWLHEARPWATDPSRRRNLATHWGKLASRSQHASHWQHALQTLHPLLTGEELVDWKMAAMIYDRLGDAEHAMAANQRIVELAQDKRDQAIALNNIGSFSVAVGRDLPGAEAKVKEALELHAAAEFVDTLVTIQVRRGQPALAIRTLQHQCSEFPRDIALRIRLVELLVRQERPADALAVLAEIETLGQQGTEPTLSQWQRVHELRRQLEPPTDEARHT